MRNNHINNVKKMEKNRVRESVILTMIQWKNINPFCDVRLGKMSFQLTPWQRV